MREERVVHWSWDETADREQRRANARQRRRSGGRGQRSGATVALNEAKRRALLEAMG